MTADSTTPYWDDAVKAELSALRDLAALLPDPVGQYVFNHTYALASLVDALLDAWGPLVPDTEFLISAEITNTSIKSLAKGEDGHASDSQN